MEREEKVRAAMKNGEGNSEREQVSEKRMEKQLSVFALRSEEC